MPAKVEEIKNALMQDPDFKPQEGRTKEESAWAVAWSKFKNMKKNAEVLSMQGALAKQEDSDESSNPFINPPWKNADIEDAVAQYQDLLGVKNPEEAYEHVKNDNPNLEDEGQKCWFWIGIKSNGLPTPSGEAHEQMEKLLMSLFETLHKQYSAPENDENEAADIPKPKPNEMEEDRHQMLDKAIEGFQNILKAKTKRPIIHQESSPGVFFPGRMKLSGQKRFNQKYGRWPKTIRKQDPWQGETGPKKSGMGDAKFPDYAKKDNPGYIGKHRTAVPHLHGKPGQAGSNWKPYLKENLDLEKKDKDKKKKLSEYTGLMVRKEESPALDLFANFMQKEYGVDIEKKAITINTKLGSGKPVKIKVDSVYGRPSGGYMHPRSADKGGAFFVPVKKEDEVEIEKELPKPLKGQKIVRPDKIITVPKPWKPFMKGGAGSGRHASRKTMRVRAKFKPHTTALKAAIAGYGKSRKPSDYAKIVAAFREKDVARAKVKPWWQGMRHPMD